MTKNYYEKYWQEKNDNLGHANNTPQWPKRELGMFYNSVKKFIGKDILDVGAGEGIFIEYLKEKNKTINRIIALEISSKAIEKGKERNSNIDYFEGSADGTYPFGDQEFDTLFMTDVIEHLVDIDQAVSECNRILKEEGRVIIITPVFNWLKKIIIASFFWEKFFYPNNPHIRFFTKKSMDSIMKKHGFERIFYKWGLTWFRIMPQNAYFVYKKVK